MGYSKCERSAHRRDDQAPTPTTSAQSVGFQSPGLALVIEALERAVGLPLVDHPERRDQDRPERLAAAWSFNRGGA